MYVESSITGAHYQKTAIWRKCIRRDSLVLHLRDYQLVPVGFVSLVSSCNFGGKLIQTVCRLGLLKTEILW